MKYMMLIYGSEGALTQAEREACYGESATLAHGLRAKGYYLGASPLQSVSTATSVRVRDGKRFVTDGPFAETREQLGGYYLIEAPDIDTAVDIAAQIPGAKFGTVEIRPIVVLENLPDVPAQAEAVGAKA
jgi:hypothetical protein